MVVLTKVPISRSLFSPGQARCFRSAPTKNTAPVPTKLSACVTVRNKCGVSVPIAQQASDQAQWICSCRARCVRSHQASVPTKRLFPPSVPSHQASVPTRSTADTLPQCAWEPKLGFSYNTPMHSSTSPSSKPLVVQNVHIRTTPHLLIHQSPPGSQSTWPSTGRRCSEPPPPPPPRSQPPLPSTGSRRF